MGVEYIKVELTHLLDIDDYTDSSPEVKYRGESPHHPRKGVLCFWNYATLSQT